MVPFAGWNMPIQYAGVMEEHRTVREGVGVFDVSHMGEIDVRGPEAKPFFQKLLTNDMDKLDKSCFKWNASDASWDASLRPLAESERTYYFRFVPKSVSK